MKGNGLLQILRYWYKKIICDSYERVLNCEKLKQSDNQTFNLKRRALFQSDSLKVPFGILLQKRQIFIYNKWVAKKWFSSTLDRSREIFYNPQHFYIQEEDENDSKDDIEIIKNRIRTVNKFQMNITKFNFFR